MNNKNETSFIEIIKGKIKDGRTIKERLAVLLLTGVLLLVIAMPAEREADETYREEEENRPVLKELSYEEKLAGELEGFLREVEGVGEVRVLVRVNGSRERIVEKDRSEEGQEEETVYEETEDGRQIPYVIRENAPEIEGVIIAAQGGDQPAVVQNIIKAVQALLQIDAHKIKVLKMKGSEGFA